MQVTGLILIMGSALILSVNAQSDPVCDACPSKNCTYVKKLSCYCKAGNRTIEIISPGDIEYFNVSLGFAVDDTGSMGTEIASVKASIQSVVLATAGIFDKFVVGTFNDPYSMNVFESTNAAAINGFVSTITAGGGGDCPEYALSGIRDVANRVSPGSIIFVFTDASAKDLLLEPTLLALLQSKNIRLNVMATGDLCGGLGSEFSRLTSATNGTIYMTPNKADVDYVMSYIKNFAKYGIRFIRGMPKTLSELIAIANGSCACDTSVSNLVCIPPPVQKCPCPKGYELVEVKKKVCHPPPCVPKYGTLGFVIDNTGSMGAEIFAVKSTIADIMANNTIFKDFVVGEFGDPYVKHVINSMSVSVIQAFVNGIVASGGGDCPEFAMSGIEDAANLCLDNSILVLFTDASAKDASKLAAVKALLMAKKIKLLVIATGTFCGPEVYKGEFHDLASSTGGAVMTLTAKTSAKEVLDFIAAAAAGKYPMLPFPTSLEGMRKIPPVKCCEWIVKLECRRINQACPPGYKRVYLNRRVCEPANACRRKRVGSLGFLIDDTGSMGAEIFAVKNAVNGIMAANTRFMDFVVGTFNDPYVKHVIRSDNASVIKTFVNAITPNGGGDCPEFAMSGIEDAAKLALDYSILVMFTDASAKDASKTAAVAALLVAKHIRLFVVATGTLCDGLYKGEFHYLAKVSGGGIMTLTSKTSVKDILDFIKLAAAGKRYFSDMSSKAFPPKPAPEFPNCFMQEISTCQCDCLNDHY